MPHAALWVVQLLLSNCCKHHLICFNAARGFVGGAAESVPESYPCRTRFNAARGFVGGAALMTGQDSFSGLHVSMPHAALWVVQPSSLAALVPLGRKSPFGKSPEI